jgi:hypothetical protein
LGIYKKRGRRYKMQSWRENVDPLIKEHLEAQIRETTKHQSTYMQSSSPQTAQLWVAVANLSKQVFNLNLKIKYMEKLVKDTLEKVEQGNFAPRVSEPVSLILNAKPEPRTRDSKGRIRIGHVDRDPKKMVYVDGEGDVYQTDFKKKGKKSSSKKSSLRKKRKR